MVSTISVGKTETPSEKGNSRRRELGGLLLLLSPALLILTVFFLVPLLDVVWRSVTDPQPGIDNYIWLVTTESNVAVMTRTFGTAFVVTAVCLLMSYPYAYLMTIVGDRARNLLQLAVLLPLWTSILVRTLAWMVLLQDTGPINALLQAVNLGPVPLIRTTLGVALGMSQVLLPFMVLPLYATMSRINRDFLSAATSLGARPVTAFWTVYLPLSRPGMIAGSITVFILGLGFYIIPALLGSSKEIMISALIQQQISSYLMWGYGATLGITLLIITVVVLVSLQKMSRGASLFPVVDRS